MNNPWRELKETIIEMRDNDGTCTQQEVCKFLANLMDVLEKQMSESCDDCISRQAAIDALWKAMYEYEDRTEKQFQESDELDIGDWIIHRNFVQNMNDIDRQTILNLPLVTPQPKIGRWIESKGYDDRDNFYTCSKCGRSINLICGATLADYPYCHCGVKMQTESDE